MAAVKKRRFKRKDAKRAKWVSHATARRKAGEEHKPPKPEKKVTAPTPYSSTTSGTPGSGSSGQQGGSTTATGAKPGKVVTTPSTGGQGGPDAPAVSGGGTYPGGGTGGASPSPSGKSGSGKVAASEARKKKVFQEARARYQDRMEEAEDLREEIRDTNAQERKEEMREDLLDHLERTEKPTRKFTRPGVKLEDALKVAKPVVKASEKVASSTASEIYEAAKEVGAEQLKGLRKAKHPVTTKDWAKDIGEQRQVRHMLENPWKGLNENDADDVRLANEVVGWRTKAREDVKADKKEHRVWQRSRDRNAQELKPAVEALKDQALDSVVSEEAVRILKRGMSEDLNRPLEKEEKKAAYRKVKNDPLYDSSREEIRERAKVAAREAKLLGVTAEEGTERFALALERAVDAGGDRAADFAIKRRAEIDAWKDKDASPLGALRRGQKDPIKTAAEIQRARLGRYQAKAAAEEALSGGERVLRLGETTWDQGNPVALAKGALAAAGASWQLLAHNDPEQATAMLEQFDKKNPFWNLAKDVTGGQNFGDAMVDFSLRTEKNPVDAFAVAAGAPGFIRFVTKNPVDTSRPRASVGYKKNRGKDVRNPTAERKKVRRRAGENRRRSREINSEARAEWQGSQKKGESDAEAYERVLLEKTEAEQARRTQQAIDDAPAGSHHQAYSRAAPTRYGQKAIEQYRYLRGRDPFTVTGRGARKFTKSKVLGEKRRSTSAGLHASDVTAARVVIAEAGAIGDGLAKRAGKLINSAPGRFLESPETAALKRISAYLIAEGSVKAGDELAGLEAQRATQAEFEGEHAAKNVEILDELIEDVRTNGDAAIIKDPRVHDVAAIEVNASQGIDAQHPTLEPAQARYRTSIQEPAQQGKVVSAKKGESGHYVDGVLVAIENKKGKLRDPKTGERLERVPTGKVEPQLGKVFRRSTEPEVAEKPKSGREVEIETIEAQVKEMEEDLVNPIYAGSRERIEELIESANGRLAELREGSKPEETKKQTTPRKKPTTREQESAKRAKEAKEERETAAEERRKARGKAQKDSVRRDKMTKDGVEELREAWDAAAALFAAADHSGTKKAELQALSEAETRARREYRATKQALRYEKGAAGREADALAHARQRVTDVDVALRVAESEGNKLDGLIEAMEEKLSETTVHEVQVHIGKTLRLLEDRIARGDKDRAMDADEGRNMPGGSRGSFDVIEPGESPRVGPLKDPAGDVTFGDREYTAFGKVKQQKYWKGGEYAAAYAQLLAKRYDVDQKMEGLKEAKLISERNLASLQNKGKQKAASAKFVTSPSKRKKTKPGTSRKDTPRPLARSKTRSEVEGLENLQVAEMEYERVVYGDGESAPYDGVPMIDYELDVAGARLDLFEAYAEYILNGGEKVPRIEALARQHEVEARGAVEDVKARMEKAVLRDEKSVVEGQGKRVYKKGERDLEGKERKGLGDGKPQSRYRQKGTSKPMLRGMAIPTEGAPARPMKVEKGVPLLHDGALWLKPEAADPEVPATGATGEPRGAGTGRIFRGNPNQAAYVADPVAGLGNKLGLTEPDVGSLKNVKSLQDRDLSGVDLRELGAQRQRLASWRLFTKEFLRLGFEGGRVMDPEEWQAMQLELQGGEAVTSNRLPKRVPGSWERTKTPSGDVLIAVAVDEGPFNKDGPGPALHEGTGVRLAGPDERAVLMPKAALDALALASRPPGRVIGLGQWLSRQHVAAILPFSLGWHLGNVADLITRLAVSGMVIGSKEMSEALYNAMARVDGEQWADYMYVNTQGHFGAQREAASTMTLREITDSDKDDLWKAMGNFFTHLRHETKVGQTTVGGLRALADKAFNAAVVVEGPFVAAANGIAAKRLAAELGADIGDHMQIAARLAVATKLDPSLMDEFGKKAVEIVGDYQMSPFVRKWVSPIDPFFRWVVESNKFIYYHFPAKHPAKFALFVMTANMGNEMAEKLGLEMYLNPPLGFLAQAIPVGGGMWRPTSPFTSWGESSKMIEDPLEYIAGKVFPYAQEIGAIAQGYKPEVKGGVVAWRKLQGKLATWFPEDAAALGLTEPENGNWIADDDANFLTTKLADSDGPTKFLASVEAGLKAVVPGYGEASKVARSGGFPDGAPFSYDSRPGTARGWFPLIDSPLSPFAAQPDLDTYGEVPAKTLHEAAQASEMKVPDAVNFVIYDGEGNAYLSTGVRGTTPIWKKVSMAEAEKHELQDRPGMREVPVIQTKQGDGIVPFARTKPDMKLGPPATRTGTGDRIPPASRMGVQGGRGLGSAVRDAQVAVAHAVGQVTYGRGVPVKDKVAVARRLAEAVKKRDAAAIGGEGVPAIVPEEYRKYVAKYGPMLDEGVKASGFDISGTEYLGKLIQFESGWKEGLTSDAGATGLGQFMPGTNQTFINEYGVDASMNGSVEDQIKGAAMHASGDFGHSALYAGYNPYWVNPDTGTRVMDDPAADPIVGMDSGGLVGGGKPAKRKPVDEALIAEAQATLGPERTRKLLNSRSVTFTESAVEFRKVDGEGRQAPFMNGKRMSVEQIAAFGGAEAVVKAAKAEPVWSGKYDGAQGVVQAIVGARVRGDKEEGHTVGGDHDPSVPNAYAQDINGMDTSGVEREPPYTQETLDTIVANIKELGYEGPDPGGLALGGDWSGTVAGYRVQLITSPHGTGPHIHLGARNEGGGDESLTGGPRTITVGGQEEPPAAATGESATAGVPSSVSPAESFAVDVGRRQESVSRETVSVTLSGSHRLAPAATDRIERMLEKAYDGQQSRQEILERVMEELSGPNRRERARRILDSAQVNRDGGYDPARLDLAMRFLDGEMSAAQFALESKSVG